MQTQIKIITGILIAILFYSCEKTIEFEGELTNTQIVVNGILRPGEQISAGIYESKSFLEDADFFESITNAKADLYVDGTFVETLLYEEKVDTLTEYLEYGVTNKTIYNSGNYFGETTIEAGKTYRLEVSCDGLNTVNCETTVPIPVQITNVDTSSTEFEAATYQYTLLTFTFTFTDEGSTNNFYRMRTDNIIGNPLGYHESDTTIYTDTIIISFTENAGFSTSDPIFNDNNNEANEIVMGAPVNQYAIFTDGNIDGAEYNLKISYSYLTSNEYQTPGSFNTKKFFLSSLSEEYYNYLNSANYHFWYDEDYFSEPVPVYSNVEGGMGIWASESFSQYNFTHGEYPIDGKTYVHYEDYISQYY